MNSIRIVRLRFLYASLRSGTSAQFSNVRPAVGDLRLTRLTKVRERSNRTQVCCYFTDYYLKVYDRLSLGEISVPAVGKMASWPGLHLRKHLGVLLLLFLGVLASPISGLRCYQCGQYTDGPGSITPCLNYTDALHLKECPPETTGHCIKYVNEGSIVRDCAEECNEKRSDSWGTSIYCCTEDACNAATSARLHILAGGVISSVVLLNHLRLSVFPRAFLLPYLRLFY